MVGRSHATSLWTVIGRVLSDGNEVGRSESNQATADESS